MAEDSTQPPHATRFVETTRGILSYAQLAPLLAERVLRVQEDIEDGVFADRPFDETLLLDFHRAICGDLTPDWAGRFRAGEVKVGQHSPPLPHQVPLLVRDYFADLNARLAVVSLEQDALLVETLAFAEGRCFPFIRFPISTVASRACCWRNCSGEPTCRRWNSRPPAMRFRNNICPLCARQIHWIGSR